jgi:hypothetical protein
VCVRYGEARRERWKTVELIIEKSAWYPPPQRGRAATLVALQVAAQERAIRQQVKPGGGKWKAKEVVWELPYGQL